MKTHLARSALVLGFCAIAAFGQKPEWKEYQYVEDGFAISAPVKPTMEEEIVKADGDKKMVGHPYKIDLGAPTEFGIVVYQPANAEKLPAKEALQLIEYGIIHMANAKHSAEKEISLDNHPGVEFELETEVFHALARCYLVDDRLIVLMAAAPIGKPLPSETKRIFDSLRLLKPPQK